MSPSSTSTGAPTQTHRTVLVRDGKIEEIGSSAGGVGGKLAGPHVDGTGNFLIPGLWDMHVHMVFGDWFPRGKEVTLPLFIANGITGVRDMGGELEVLQQWRKEIAAGTLIGPRMVIVGPMLDGPQPRFPSSIAIATPEDGRRAVDDLKRRGADFVKLQSLIPREAVFAIAEEARKQGITFVGHVPDSVRASEASNAGQKSFEHLIGIFEGSSPLEDAFLKGPKTQGQFLSTYDPKRAAALFALLAKNHTWQCPTLVWERGGNLIDQTDFAHDTRAKYAPAYWKDVTWKRFTEEIMHDFNTDDLATRKRFVEKRTGSGERDAPRRDSFSRGHGHASRRLHFPRLQLARGIAAIRCCGFHADGSAANGDAESGKVPRDGRPAGNNREGKTCRSGPAGCEPSR